MSKLWPRTHHVRVKLDLLSDNQSRFMLLSDRAYRALMRLVHACAIARVWTYSAPGDGTLRDDDAELAALARLSPRAWRSVRYECEPFFAIRAGRWALADETWIVVEREARTAPPEALQARISAREGSLCTYCGDTVGPFEFDHIFPVARGGADDASNLTLACERCNRSKGAKTLREWMAVRE